MENKKKLGTGAIIGIIASIICLFLFGKANFILPALLISTALLFMIAKKEVGTNE